MSQLLSPAEEAAVLRMFESAPLPDERVILFALYQRLCQRRHARIGAELAIAHAKGPFPLPTPTQTGNQPQ